MNSVTGHNSDDALWAQAAQAFDEELREKLAGHVSNSQMTRVIERLWEEEGSETVIQVIADELGIESPRERVESMESEAGPTAVDAITEALEP